MLRVSWTQSWTPYALLGCPGNQLTDVLENHTPEEHHRNLNGHPRSLPDVQKTLFVNLVSTEIKI